LPAFCTNDGALFDTNAKLFMADTAPWRPPSPRAPLEKAVLDAIRLNLATLLEAAPTHGGNRVPARFSATLDLPTQTRLELTLENIESAPIGRRTAALFSLRGAAAAATEAWIVTAKVAIDRDTQAALRITAEIAKTMAPAP
jgi:hypothetical protein